MYLVAVIALLQKCSVCNNEEVAIWCHECRAAPFLCALCDQEVHSAHPLNDREYWNKEHFLFIPPTQSPDYLTGNLSDVGMYLHTYIHTYIHMQLIRAATIYTYIRIYIRSNIRYIL